MDEEYQKLAQEIVLIEKNCFYGDESENARLQRIRNALNALILKLQNQEDSK